MSRTNKQGIAKKKKLQQKQGGTAQPSGFSYFKSVAKMSLEDLKFSGLVIQITNPAGRVTWWFKRGRKLNYDTRCYFDRDGFDRWGKGVRFGALSRGAGGWRGQRFRKTIKRLK